MRRIVVFLLCLVTCFVLFAQDRTVTVYAPDHYPSGQPFEARAEADGCTPRVWEFSTSTGCKVQSVKGDTAVIRCDAGTLGVVRAIAKGRGCAGVSGESSIIIAPAAQIVTLPICNDTEPGAVVTPPKTGWYYRPGTQSTGRLTLEIIKHTVITYGCVEPAGKIPK